MRLSFQNWRNTFTKLGFKAKQRNKVLLWRSKINRDQSINFVVEPLEQRQMLAGNIVGLALADDTGSSNSDLQTSDPRMDGTVTDLSWSYTDSTVQIDFNDDQVSDHQLSTINPDGTFQFDPSSITDYHALDVGLNEYAFRAVEVDPVSGDVVEGNWTDFEFYYSESDLGQIAIELDGTAISEGEEIDFGQITVGYSSTKQITIVNRGPGDLTPGNQIFTPIGYEIQNYVPTTLSPGATTTFDLVFTGDNSGEFTGPVTLFSSNANSNSFYFTVIGETKDPQVELDLPNTDSLGNVDFGSVASTDVVERTITVTNTGFGFLNLSGEFTLPTGFTLSSGLQDPFLAPMQSTTFTVAFDATTAGVYEGILTFKRPNDAGPLFLISLLGEKDIPRLAIASDDSPFDHIMQATTFGSTLVGTPISRQLTFTNQGTQTLEITEITFPEGVSHNLSNTAFDLAPGEETTFTITFDAAESRQIFDGIFVESNDPNHATFHVMVSGVAVSFDEFRLFSDDGNHQSDNVSSDPRVFGRILAGDQASDIEVLIDTDGDFTEDLVVSPEDSGTFVYDPAPNEPTQITVSAAIKVHNVVTGDDYITSWQTLAFDYDPDQANEIPEIGPISLVNDTGSVGDNISYDPTITGTVSNDGYLDGLSISIDHDGDGTVDGTAFADDQGVFVYTPAIEYDAYSMVLWVEEEVYGGGTNFSEQDTLDFTFVEVTPPSITLVDLKYDTGTHDFDYVTSIGILVGTAEADTDSSQFAVEWDVDGDAFADGLAWVDEDGNFEITPGNLPVGETTIYLRGADPHRGVSGPWSESISFTIESMHAPIVDFIELLEDDGPSDTDQSSTKPDVVGTLTSEYGSANRIIQFDHNADGVVDGVTVSDSDGEFAYEPIGIKYGDVDLRYRTTIFDEVTQTDLYGQWQVFTFEFVGLSLAGITDLRLENDNGDDPDDGITSDPTLLATTTIDGAVASFIEVEFDYDNDDSIDASVFSDELGQVRHYASVVTGDESKVRVRARQWDNVVGDYVYSDWNEITFTRMETDYAFSPEVYSAQTLIDRSQEIADEVYAAIASIFAAGSSTFNGNVNGITGTNNDPGYLLDGFNLGVAVYSAGHGIGGLGIGSFGDTGAEDGTLLLDTSFLAPVRGNSSDLTATTDSQIIAVSIHESQYTITGTHDFTFSVTNGINDDVTTFDSLFTFTFTPTNGLYTITGSLGIDFDATTTPVINSVQTSFTAIETFEFEVIWDTVTAEGLNEDSTISFEFSNTFSNGVINGGVDADASMDYAFERDFTNTIGIEGVLNFDPVAYANLVATNAEGTIDYDQELSKTVDYDESGSYGFVAGNSAQTATLFTLIETGTWSNIEIEDSEFEVTEGAAGTITGQRDITTTENYSYGRDESGSYFRDNTNAVVDSSTYFINESGFSSRSGNSSGSFVVSDLPGNQHSGTYTRTFSESITYSYAVEATYVRYVNGDLEVDGSFISDEFSETTNTLVIDGVFDKDVNGVNYNGDYHIEYLDDGESTSGQTGWFFQDNFDLTVDGTATLDGHVLAANEQDFNVYFASLDTYNNSPTRSGYRYTESDSTFEMLSEESSDFVYTNGVLNGEGTFWVDQETVIDHHEIGSLTLNNFEIGNMPSTYNGDDGGGGGDDGMGGFGGGGGSTPYSFIPVFASGTSDSETTTESTLRFIDSGGFAYGTNDGFAKTGSFNKTEEHDTIYATDGNMTYTQATDDGERSYDKTWNVISESDGTRYIHHTDNGTYVTFGTDIMGDVLAFAGMGGNDVGDGPTASGYLSTIENIIGTSSSTTSGVENEFGPDDVYMTTSFGSTEDSENTSYYTEDADYDGNDASRTREGDYTITTTAETDTTSWTIGSFFEIYDGDGVADSESNIASESGTFSSNMTMLFSMNSFEDGQFEESEIGETSSAEFTIHQESSTSGDQTSEGTRVTLNGRDLPYSTYSEFTDETTTDEDGNYSVNLEMEKSTYAEFDRNTVSTNLSEYSIDSWVDTDEYSGRVTDTAVTNSTVTYDEDGFYSKSPVLDDRQTDFTRNNEQTSYTTSLLVGELNKNPRNGVFQNGTIYDWSWEDSHSTVDEEGHISQYNGTYGETGTYGSTLDVTSYSSTITVASYFLVSPGKITIGDLYTKDTVHTILDQEVTAGSFSVNNDFEESRSGTKSLTDSSYSTNSSVDSGVIWQATVRSGWDTIPGTNDDYDYRQKFSIFDKTTSGHSRSVRTESNVLFTDSAEVVSAEGDFTELTIADVTTKEEITVWYVEYSDGRGGGIGSYGGENGSPNGQGGDLDKPFFDVGFSTSDAISYSFSRSVASGTFDNADYTDDQNNVDVESETADTSMSVSFNAFSETNDYTGTRTVYLENGFGAPTSAVDFVDEYSGNSYSGTSSFAANTNGTYSVIDGKLDSEYYKTRTLNISGATNDATSTITLIYIPPFELKPAIPDSEAPFTLQELPLFGFAPSKLPGFVALLVGVMSDNNFGYYTRMEFEITEYASNPEITKVTEGNRNSRYEEWGSVNTTGGTTTTIDTEFKEKEYIWSKSTLDTLQTHIMDVNRDVTASEGGGIFGDGNDVIGHLLVIGTRTIDVFNVDTYELDSNSNGEYLYTGPYISEDVLGIISNGNLPDPYYTISTDGKTVEKTTSDTTNESSFDMHTVSTRYSDNATFTFRGLDSQNDFGIRTDDETYHYDSTKTTEFDFSYAGEGDGRTTGTPPAPTEDTIDPGYSEYFNKVTFVSSESYNSETTASGHATATGGNYPYENKFNDSANKAENVEYTTTRTQQLSQETGEYTDAGTFNESVVKSHDLTIDEEGHLAGGDIAYWTYDNVAEQDYTLEHSGTYDDEGEPVETLQAEKSYVVAGEAFDIEFLHEADNEDDLHGSFWDIFRFNFYGFGNWLARQTNDFLMDPSEYFEQNKEGILDALQYALDVVGVLDFIPPLAIAADALNGTISLARGDHIGAALSFAAAIPFAGNGATAAKWAYKGAKVSGVLGSIGGKVAKGFNNTVGGASNLAAKSFDLARGASKKAGDLASNVAKSTKNIFKNSDGTFSLGLRRGCFVAETPVVVYTYVEPQMAFLELPTCEENKVSNNFGHLGLYVSMGAMTIVVITQQSRTRRRKISEGDENRRSTMNSSTPEPIVRSEREVAQRLCIEFTDAEPPQEEWSDPAIPSFGSHTPKASQFEPQSLYPSLPTTHESMDRRSARVTKGAIQPSGSSKMSGRISEQAVSPPKSWLKANWPSLTCVAAIFGILTSLITIAADRNQPISDVRQWNSSAVFNGAPDSTQEQPGWKQSILNIEDIRVGQRLPAHNPLLSDEERQQAAFDVDTTTWRTFQLEIEKEDGEELEVTLLRPTDWMVDRILETAALASIAEQEFDSDAADSSSAVLLSRSTSPKRKRGWSQTISDIANQDFKLAEISPSKIAWCLLGPFSKYLFALDPQTVVSTGTPISFVAGQIQRVVFASHLEAIAIERAFDELATNVTRGEFVDAFIYLNMPEMGAAGLARIVAVESAPDVRDGPGQIVTGTFKHRSAEVLDLSFKRVATNRTDPNWGPWGVKFERTGSTAGLQAPDSHLISLAVTASHPFWVDRLRNFVPAESIKIGESITGLDNQTWRLTSVVPRDGPQDVFNLEVSVEHVFYVNASGFLVHNVCDETIRNFQKHLIEKLDRPIPPELVRIAKNLVKRIHGHHIVMKGAFSGWGDSGRRYVKYSQRVLKEAGIDIHDGRNLAHAINGGHSKAYAMAVAKNLQRARRTWKQKGGNLEEYVTKELNVMREILEKGRTFW